MTFILVDCNNFYASCERLFNPKLERKPLIILSNNDGIVVARSEEAKRLGIAMGEVFFKIRDFCHNHKVIVYSSNYQLYGDLSERIMNILSASAPEIEIYSIDEAFLCFPPSIEDDELVKYCDTLRQTIKQWVGIPVSMGIGPTKTLAKAANRVAKKSRGGVFDLRSSVKQKQIFSRFPIEDVWGIGRKWKEKLHGLGVRTVEEFRTMDPVFVRQKMGVIGERMLRELQGTSCLSLEIPETNKSITSSRSFGVPISDFVSLSETLSTYAASACEKLRSQGSCAQAISVWVEIQWMGQRRCYSAMSTFIVPTQETPQVITKAKQILAHLFRPNELYKKCGIILLDLVPKNNVIPDFFWKGPDPKREQLAKTIDFLNGKLGKDAIFYGAMGIHHPWQVRSENRSQRYTTCWNELALVS